LIFQIFTEVESVVNAVLNCVILDDLWSSFHDLLFKV